MKRMIIPILMLCSCHSSHYTAGTVAGEYRGREGTKYVGFGYRLALRENHTCRFEKYFDLYNLSGDGIWDIHGDSILIEYEPYIPDVADVLQAGGQKEGRDTVLIKNSRKLKMNKIVLKKRKRSSYL